MDINSDGVVNIQDLVLVASSFGQTGQNRADVNGDGVVNIQDLVLVAGAFGDGASAPALHLQDLKGLTAADVQHLLTQARQMSTHRSHLFAWRCGAGTTSRPLTAERNGSLV